MKHGIIFGLAVLSIQMGLGQSVRSLVNGGNDLYRDKKFTDAEVNYRKALEKEKDLVQGHFNLGNALAKQGKGEEAAKEYSLAAEKAQHPETKESAYFNIGNTQMASQQYGDAIRSYVEALKIDPKDEEAKYNLSYALAKLRQQQQQNQKNKNNKDQNQQKNKDQNKDQENKQNKNDQKKQQQPKDQQANRQQQEKRISKSDAERILEVLKNSEKDVQKKLHTRPAERPTTEKDW